MPFLIISLPDLDFPTVPKDYNTWMDTEAMIQFHLRAIDKQLIQASVDVWRVWNIGRLKVIVWSTSLSNMYEAPWDPIEPCEPDLESPHFLLQVYRVMAIAVMLNRTLVSVRRNRC